MKVNELQIRVQLYVGFLVNYQNYSITEPNVNLYPQHELQQDLSKYSV